MVHPIFKALTVLLAASLLTTCTPDPTPTRRPTPRPPTAPPPTVPATADLSMGETHVERYNDQYLTYQIVATIVNDGAGTATGFSAGCTYKCPPGGAVTSAGLDIVQGGYLKGKSRFTYKTPFHYACAARPPTLNLMCTVRSAQGDATYSVNVTLP